MRITYQKRNGDVFQRTITTWTPYRVGDSTSMGWKVLNIEKKYKNKYYSLQEYDNLIQKEFQREKMLSEIKKKALKIYKELVYIMLLLILVRFYNNLNNLM